MQLEIPVDWQGTNCQDAETIGTDAFYPERGTAQKTAKSAKAICNGEDGRHGVCPFRDACLEYAIKRRDRFGVWGGMSEPDRSKEIKRRKLAAAEVLARDETPRVSLEKPVEIAAVIDPEIFGTPTPPAPRVPTLVRRRPRPVVPVAEIPAARTPTVIKRRPRPAVVRTPTIVTRRPRPVEAAQAREDNVVSINRVTKRKPTPGTVARRPTGDLARFAGAKKDGGRLLPGVQRHLMARPQDTGRRQDLIHVSEMAKNDWCPRATYLRIKAAREGRNLDREAPRFQLDNIFEEGNRIHAKWQTWLWDMGTLWGKFHCHGCGNTWWDTSPVDCFKCSADRESLEYRELPMQDQDNLIIGHADGEVRDDDGTVLIEIKSIGIGTVRVEHPKMVAQYTRKYVDDQGTTRSYLDHDGLWRDLHRPFASHLRQGLIYLYLRNLMSRQQGWAPVKKIVFIYEYKPTQAVKEFTIGADDEYVSELLDVCKDITYALDNEIEPYCLKGRRDRCAACKTIDLLNEDRDDDSQKTQSTPRARRGDDAREGEGRESRPVHAQATGGPTRIARRPDRPRRPGSDDSAGSAHSLGRLLRRAAGDGVR